MLTRLARSTGLLTVVATFVAAASGATFDLSTPEKANALCIKAFYDGDAGALKAAGYFAPGFDDLFKAFVKRGQALAAARQAVADKFGFLAVKDYDRLLDRPLPMPTKMLVTGDTAKLIVASDEGQSVIIPVAEFKKTNGQWQQLITDTNAPKAATEKRRLAVHVEALVIEGFAKDLAAGKYAKTEAAAAALSSSIASLNKSGDPESHEAVHVARWFKFGLGVDRDFPLAYTLFCDAAAQGDADAMVDAGRSCEDGEGTPKNPAAAFKWYQKAADAKNGEGQLRLGVCYQKGVGTPKDPAKGLMLLNEAVKSYDWTLNYLGDTYRDGLGVKADDAKALNYYEKSAKKNKSGYAMYEAGRCYDRGHAVPKDAKKAVVWYSRSAKEGNENGLCELARHMEAGDGTIKNPTGARTWYEKAAKEGSKDAAAWVKAHPAK